MLPKASRGVLLVGLLFAGTCAAQEFYQLGPVEALVYRTEKEKVFLTLTRRQGTSPAERLAVGAELTLRGEEAAGEGIAVKFREGEAEVAGQEKWAPLSGVYRRRSETERLGEAQARAEKLDAELNRVYGEVRKKLNAARAGDLRDLQREWIRYAYEAGEGAKGAPDASSAEYWQTRGDRAAERIQFLKDYATNTPAANAQELRAQLAAAEEANARSAVAEIARRILAGAPRDSAIWEKRARAFAGNEDWERCTATLDEWAKAVPQPPVVISAIRGEVSLAAEELEETARHWTVFIKATPKDTEIRDRLAGVLERQEKWADAAVIREQRLKNAPDAEVFARLAVDRAVLRDWKAMSAAAQRGNQLDATSDFVKVTLPRVERLEKALPELKKLDAAIGNPPALNPLLERAEFFAKLRWPEIALADAQAALRRNAASRRAALQTAEQLLVLHRREEIEKLENVNAATLPVSPRSFLRELGAADEELSANGPSAPTLARRAHYLNLARQRALAIEDADAALKLDERNDSALGAKAEALAETGRAWEAVPLFARATEINPRNVHAWYWRGEIESRHRNFTGAVEALSKALELDPLHRSALLLREKNLRAQNKHTEADLDRTRYRALPALPLSRE